MEIQSEQAFEFLILHLAQIPPNIQRHCLAALRYAHLYLPDIVPRFWRTGVRQAGRRERPLVRKDDRHRIGPRARFARAEDLVWRRHVSGRYRTVPTVEHANHLANEFGKGILRKSFEREGKSDLLEFLPKVKITMPDAVMDAIGQHLAMSIRSSTISNARCF
jgi:hypothetical protein